MVLYPLTGNKAIALFNFPTDIRDWGDDEGEQAVSVIRSTNFTEQWLSGL